MGKDSKGDGRDGRDGATGETGDRHPETSGDGGENDRIINLPLPTPCWAGPAIETLFTFVQLFFVALDQKAEELCIMHYDGGLGHDDLVTQ